MISKSTKEAILRRMTSLREKFSYLTLDVSLVENIAELRSFFQLPSGISPEEWDCEPELPEIAKAVSEGKGAIVAIWDDGQDEKVVVRLFDELNVFTRIDQLEKSLPPPQKKKSASRH